MLSKRERLLVHVMVWVLVAAAAGVGLFLQLERRADVRKKVRVITEQMGKFGARASDEGGLARQKQELSQALARDKDRFYTAQEMDPYRFGIIIRDLLVREGLEIGRYQTLEGPGDNLLEFAVSGQALGLARFMQKVSGSPKRWLMPFLSISAQGGKGKVQAVFRIGYEKVDEVAR